MQPELYLITPPDAGAAFADSFDAALAAAPVAACLIQRGAMSDTEYAARAEALIPLAQRHGAAALLDNAPALARTLGADGVHVTAGIEALRTAISTLKPDLIVGAGAIAGRHDAMQAAEAGADYVFFGSLGTAPPDDRLREIARWWVEAVEVPAVYFPGDPGPGTDDPVCEFLALRGSVWDAPAGARAALAAFADAHRRGAA